jgi:hypothetical protein
MAIAPDTQELMYTLATLDNSFRSIIQITLKGNTIIRKEIAPFSGKYNDIEPFYTPDGQTLFFSSTRPLHDKDSTSDYNIWFVEKMNGAWSDTPKPVGDSINTEADEFYPSLASNGNLYFTAAYTKGKGREDIYVSSITNGHYGPAISLDTNVNTANYEFNAFVSPAEDVLILSSYGRPDDMGGGDLYLSTKDASGQWSKAKNMGPKINSPQLDYCPYIDYHTSTFYFTSNRKPEVKSKLNLTDFNTVLNNDLNGMGNIYFIGMKTLEIK